MLRRSVAAVMFLVSVLLCPALVSAQSTNATITGFVTDPQKALVVGAKVSVINMDTNLRYTSTTNDEGSYTVANLPPGNYKIEVEKQGFKSIVKPDVVLHVQDAVALNFEMAIGSASESVTVTGGAPLMNTESAAVSTVVERQFAENLPMKDANSADTRSSTHSEHPKRFGAIQREWPACQFQLLDDRRSQRKCGDRSEPTAGKWGRGGIAGV